MLDGFSATLDPRAVALLEQIPDVVGVYPVRTAFPPAVSEKLLESESFGLAALEAMACEVPVISSDAGGLPEVVEDGVTGFMRPVGDVEGMTAATLRLLGDEDLRRRLGEAARRQAVARFSQDTVVGRYRSLYERVTGLP